MLLFKMFKNEKPAHLVVTTLEGIWPTLNCQGWSTCLESGKIFWSSFYKIVTNVLTVMFLVWK